jgi:hypothetical protein
LIASDEFKARVSPVFLVARLLGIWRNDGRITITLYTEALPGLLIARAETHKPNRSELLGLEQLDQSAGRRHRLY